MKRFYPFVLACTLLFIPGCSEQKETTESGKNDHVLRQQIDVMNDAKAVSETLNENAKAQDEQARQLTGH